MRKEVVDRPYVVVPFFYEEMARLGLDVSDVEPGGMRPLVLYLSELKRGVGRWITYEKPSPYTSENGLQVFKNDVALYDLAQQLVEAEESLKCVKRHYGDNWKIKVSRGTPKGVWGRISAWLAKKV